MATTKKTASKSASTAKKPSSSAATTSKREAALAHDRKRRNFWSVMLFAIGILMFLFAIIGNSHAEQMNLWDHIHSFFCGVFGLAVFFVGPIFIYAAIMISMNKGKSTISAKVFQLVLFLFLFSAAIQILFVGTVGPENAENFGQVIGGMYQDGINYKGGGVSSILISFPLLLLGRVGASIIIILIIFVIFMLIANITLLQLFRAIAKPFVALHGYLKRKREEYAQESVYVKEEAERLEAEKAEQKRIMKELSEEEKRAKKISSIEAMGNSVKEDVPPKEEKEKIVPDNHYETAEMVKEQEEENKSFQELVANIANPESTSEQLTTDTVHIEEKEEQKQEEQIIPEEAPETPVDDAIQGFEEAIAEYQNELASKDKPTELVVDTVISESSDGQQVIEQVTEEANGYNLPPYTLLNDIVKSENQQAIIDSEIQNNSTILVNALKSFGVETKFLDAVRGPSVTRYELQPAPGVKISKITNLVDDIALNLATAGVRIEAPIPNKAAVGIEVPNKEKETVPIREMLDNDTFRETTSRLGAALGKNISGETVICDIAKMPHILIAGTTGAGKSVCVNSIIMSILFRSTPDEVRFIMIDPKAVEFMIYNGIPHLYVPVVTDPKKAAGALAWAVNEMEKRYKLLGENNVRDIHSYNKLAKNNPELQTMPQLVIFIDELADLMMASKNEVEASICRLAQKARAAGIHLVVATQRPSVDVITGLIKSNIPSRIALKVASQVDSRTIMDTAGAEKLLGSGDMLYKSVAMPKPMRVQGCWVSDQEVEKVTEFIKKAFVSEYDEEVIAEIEKQAERVGNDGKQDMDISGDLDINDDKLEEAIEVVLSAGVASVSNLQRRLSIGYGRGAKLIDIMESMGIVGPSEGTKPRQILITKEEWYERGLNKND